MSKKLVVGKQFPKFNLVVDRDKRISEKSFLKRKTIIFIYPKNNTGGCTKECVDFSRLIKDFETLNISIYGLSKDTILSHKKFIKKYSLKIKLISDPSAELITQVGAWVQKTMYGKKCMGSERTTFILNENNQITHIWTKVRVTGHAEEVLKACKNLIKEDNK